VSGCDCGVYIFWRGRVASDNCEREYTVLKRRMAYWAKISPVAGSSMGMLVTCQRYHPEIGLEVLYAPVFVALLLFTSQPKKVRLHIV
jgi:hypothetical protein